MNPKGKLIPVGGNETKRATKEKTASGRASIKTKMEILHRILQEAQGSQTHIEIIPTASAIPNEIAGDYLDAYTYLKAHKVGVMNIRTKLQTDKKEYLERLKQADAIMFTGGDQRKIVSAFAGTEFMDILTQRYQNEPNFVIAGTSAGAMGMSEVMIAGGDSIEAMFKGTTRIQAGLGLIKTAIIDSHFVVRGRFGRLAVAVAQHPTLTGVGLSEDTGVIITEGRYLEAIGSRLVCIFEGQEMLHTNIAEAQKQKGMVAIENMSIDMFPRGYHYDLITRRLTHIPNTHLHLV